MPMYEYQCQSCGKIFELIQRFSDEPLTVHEACGGALEKLVSAPALQFKGSGWYVNDYARPKAPNGGSGEGKGDGAKSEGTSESASKSESKGEGKSEGKSDGKSESKSESKKDSGTSSSTTSASSSTKSDK